MKNIKLFVNDDTTLILKLINFFVTINNYHFLINNDNLDNEILLTNKDETLLVRLSIVSKMTEQIYEDSLEIIKENMNFLDISLDKKLLNIVICEQKDNEFITKTDNLIETYVFNDINDILSNEEFANKFDGLVNYLKVNQDKDITSMVKEMEHHNRQSNKPKMMSISILIITLNIIIWTLIQIINIDSNAVSIALGAYYRPFIIHLDEFWRFITTGFVHIELIHLISNMYSLYFVGKLVESLYGYKKMLLIYLGSILSGSMMAHIASSADLFLGASGGVFGLFGAVMVYSIVFKNKFNQNFKRSLMNILIINIAISFLPGISFFGHYGGLFFGAILGYAYTIKDKIQKNNLFVVAIALIIIMSGIIVIQPNKSNLYLGTDRKIVDTYRKLNINFLADHYQNRIDNHYWEVKK